ncbi:MAG TPA: glycosyltransferase, partial [Candidatus Hydrogenedentes bacterium]|nr:glycosyltransferase [Candidatus Hydrogenedentota bacterium]
MEQEINGNEVPDITVCITCHFEEASIDEFHARLSAAMESLGRSYEILMVNDGSSDRTWDKLKTLFAKDLHVTCVMDFFKNAGQQAAITACMCQGRGKAFIIMDSDLQLAPEEIPLLVEEYEKGYDMVSGYRKNRHDSLLRIVPSKIANMIMRRASQSDFRDFGCTFKIYNAKLVRAFNYGPRHIFSNVDLIAQAGRRVEIPVTHYPRKYGKSGWTFRKLWQYNMDNVVKLSQRPFQILASVCLLIS